MLEGILEGQMAPQYFPVQTLKNMGATIEIAAVAEGTPFSVEGCRVVARTNPHGRSGALAFRIESEGRVVVYASDAGYASSGPPEPSIDLYRGADLLIHDSTYTPEDRRRYLDRGFSSIEDAVLCAARARRQEAGAVSLRPGLQRRRRRRAVRARPPAARRPGARQTSRSSRAPRG